MHTRLKAGPVRLDHVDPADWFGSADRVDRTGLAYSAPAVYIDLVLLHIDLADPVVLFFVDCFQEVSS